MIPRFAELHRPWSGVTDADPMRSVGAAARALTASLPSGSRIAVACGSRGIAQIQSIVRATIDTLIAGGHRPFVVTAMGSHGGGTAAGQRQLLASYGITPEAIRADVVATMEAPLVAHTQDGVPAYFDAAALSADAVLLINRVKPHTTLRSPLGSGLMKMIAIGLGNRVGAESLHRHGLQQHLVSVARTLIEHSRICGGIAILENASGEISQVAAVARDAIVEAEPALLARARSLMPSIAIDPLDVLIVQHVGKNISGTGMDPNVVGMHRRHGGEPDRRIATIIALDLTSESHGNGTGIGMADITTARLRDKIDWSVTATNCITGNFLAGVKLPLVVPSDLEAMRLAVKLHGEQARICIVRDTLSLNNLLVSENLVDEALSSADSVLLRPPAPLEFTDDGQLAPAFSAKNGQGSNRYASPAPRQALDP